MAQLRASGFVYRDTLEWTSFPETLVLSGEIACQGQIVVRVCKTLAVLEGDGAGALVQTIEYSYNAFVRDNGTFLRVDNAHSHPGHADEHHRHDQDWRTSKELSGSPTWVGEGNWPTLGEFLEMAHTWYWENRQELPRPDSVPPLGLGVRP